MENPPIIRIPNPLLAILGVAFWLTDSILGSFLFGLCFGQIYVNYRMDKENNENEE
jgi:hypothetical protein